MLKNKILIFALPFIPLTCLSTSCSTTQTHQMKHDQFVESKDRTGLEYLYEVTYHDYSWDDVTTWMNSENRINSKQGVFGCSSIHCNNFYGRSFDFCYTDMCEFVVRTNHENGHLASIGVSVGDCNLNKEKVDKIIDGTCDEKGKLNEKLLPFCMVDGINENGVICNTNVVPAKDLTPHEGEEQYFTHGTNPGKENLFYQFIPRFILDNATSAKHAVELLANRNITAMNSQGKQCDFLGISKMGYELHCMVADKNDTFILEFVNDRMSIIAGDIMTNFYYSNISPSGAGFERHHILWDNRTSILSVDDMKNLIKKVQYSPCYNIKNEQGEYIESPIWPTEFAGTTIIHVPTQIPIKLTFYNADWWFRQYWTSYSSIKDDIDAAYQKIIRGERAESPGSDVPWISTHAEVYDIENRTLNLITQEKYDNWQEFKL